MSGTDSDLPPVGYQISSPKKTFDSQDNMTFEGIVKKFFDLVFCESLVRGMVHKFNPNRLAGRLNKVCIFVFSLSALLVVVTFISDDVLNV